MNLANDIVLFQSTSFRGVTIEVNLRWRNRGPEGDYPQSSLHANWHLIAQILIAINAP